MDSTSTHKRGTTAFAAVFSLFVFAVSANLLPAVLLRAADDLGWTPTRLALASSVHFLGFFMATLVGGMVCDHVGKKGVFLTAATLMLVGALGSSSATTMLHFCIGSAVLGMGGGVMESMGAAVLVELFPRRRSLVMNLSQVVYCMGAVGAPLLVGWLLPRGVSWRTCFVGLGMLCAGMLALFAAAHLPRPRLEDRLRWDRLILLLRQRTTIGPCLAILCYVFTEFTLIMYANYYLRVHLGAPEGWAISVIAAVWCAMGVGRLLCAGFSEDHRMEGHLTFLMMAAGLLIASQVLTTDWRISYVGFVVAGLACAGIWPMIVGVAASRAPTYTATVVGVTIASGALGCVLAPPVVDGLFGTVPAICVFPICALPLPVGALLIRIGRQKQGVA